MDGVHCFYVVSLISYVKSFTFDWIIIYIFIINFIKFYLPLCFPLLKCTKIFLQRLCIFFTYDLPIQECIISKESRNG